MLPDITIINRQKRISLDIQVLQRLAHGAATASLEYPGGSISVLSGLKAVEVALVSDRVIDRVHRQFMGIKGATDVITFEHGEIVISMDTAAREAAEHSEPLEREVLRYLVHGLLHLNGHEDAQQEEAAIMWEAQEAVVQRLWPL